MFVGFIGLPRPPVEIFPMVPPPPPALREASELSIEVIGGGCMKLYDVGKVSNHHFKSANTNSDMHMGEAKLPFDIFRACILSFPRAR